MDSNAKELAEKYYRLVEEMVKKYGMSEYDVPDWHGALSEGLCIAACEWCKGTDKGLIMAAFEEFAVPYMIVAVTKERPLRAILCKVSAMCDDLNFVQKCILLSLCFEVGGDETIAVLTASSKTVLNRIAE